MKKRVRKFRSDSASRHDLFEHDYEYSNNGTHTYTHFYVWLYGYFDVSDE